MKEEILNILCNKITSVATMPPYPTDEPTCEVFGLEEAAEEISKLIPQWVPISERLPEYYHPVLVRTDTNDRLVVWRACDDDGENIYTIHKTDYVTDKTITHWCELPALPEGK